MARKSARYDYEPKQAGWIGVQDLWNKTLVHIDCRNGGAQEVFADLCRDFERAGWTLERRMFDWIFVKKDGVRWELRIGVLAPGEKPRGPYGP